MGLTTSGATLNMVYSALSQYEPCCSMLSLARKPIGNQDPSLLKLLKVVREVKPEVRGELLSLPGSRAKVRTGTIEANNAARETLAVSARRF